MDGDGRGGIDLFKNLKCAPVILHLLGYDYLGNKGIACRCHEQCLHCPILPCNKGLDLLLAHTYEPKRYGLHPAPGKAPLDILPQQRAHGVSHDPVHGPSGHLCVVELVVQLLGAFQGLINGLFGNFMESDAINSRFGLLDLFCNMPCYSLTLAVRVGCEIDVIGLIRQAFYLLHYITLGWYHFVCRQKAVLKVYVDLVFRQVLDVAHGGLHLEAFSEVSLDGPCLSG